MTLCLMLLCDLCIMAWIIGNVITVQIRKMPGIVTQHKYLIRAVW